MSSCLMGPSVVFLRGPATGQHMHQRFWSKQWHTRGDTGCSAHAAQASAAGLGPVGFFVQHAIMRGQLSCDTVMGICSAVQVCLCLLLMCAKQTLSAAVLPVQCYLRACICRDDGMLEHTSIHPGGYGMLASIEVAGVLVWSGMVCMGWCMCSQERSGRMYVCSQQQARGHISQLSSRSAARCRGGGSAGKHQQGGASADGAHSQRGFSQRAVYVMGGRGGGGERGREQARGGAGPAAID